MELIGMKKIARIFSGFILVLLLLVGLGQVSAAKAAVDQDGGFGGTKAGCGEPGEPITQECLDSLNPLVQESTLAEELSTPGGIITRFMRDYAFPLAGLILFVMLVWGGFEMMSGAASKKSIDAGKQRVVAALLGFLLLFVSYWLIQIIEVVFGVRIF